jgi:hypothetical protein
VNYGLVDVTGISPLGSRRGIRKREKRPQGRITPDHTRPRCKTDGEPVEGGRQGFGRPAGRTGLPVVKA